jgi:hypothetical protein
VHEEKLGGCTQMLDSTLQVVRNRGCCIICPLNTPAFHTPTTVLTIHLRTHAHTHSHTHTHANTHTSVCAHTHVHAHTKITLYTFDRKNRLPVLRTRVRCTPELSAPSVRTSQTQRRRRRWCWRAGRSLSRA